MTKLVFATHNKHKLREAQIKVGSNFEIISLSELNFFDDIPETEDTIEGNARLKAEFVYERFGENCFADDTGLEVEALNGQPGVFSARYAGENASYDDNVQKLLKNLGDNPNRKAMFRTCIHLIINGQHHVFEGATKGLITLQPKGTDGFGYDPVFVPEGYDKTFAEISIEEKNIISHRGKALDKLCDFLSKTAK